MAFNYYTIIIGFLIGFILFFKLPRLKKAKCVKADDIKVSIIIPARNEEDNLPKLLADLKNQSYDIHEIICVDDNSEDKTPEVIRSFGVKCVQLDDLPEGWKGKTWACQNGATAATGEVLLFIDADVRLSVNAIESLVVRYIRNGKPLSVQPYHTVKKQHEFFSLFFNLIEICVTGMSVLGIKKKSGFYGPLFMISKELFDKHSGYTNVKNDVIEDFNLGRYYNKQGIDIDLILGSEHVQFSMYPKSFGSLFEGWSKNFASGSISMLWWLLVLVFAWIAFMTVLPFEIINVALNWNLPILILLSILYIVSVGLIYRALRNTGSYPLYVCILYPVYLIVFHIIFIYSIFATFVFKSTTWKGRVL